MTVIRELNAEEVSHHQNDLIELLVDTVESGASIGFLPPLSHSEAEEYWSTVIDAMRGGSRILSVAFLEGQIAGAVQLSLEPRANGNHRAEVMKLMAHRRSRGRGIGKALMSHVEEVARKNGRTLIVLDTRSGCGDAAEQLYYKLGYKKGGVIPRYARSACGTLHDTVFMYRELEG
jgi:acetyltransferase